MDTDTETHEETDEEIESDTDRLIEIKIYREYFESHSNDCLLDIRCYSRDHI